MTLIEQAEEHRPKIDGNIFRGYDIRGDATQIPSGPKVNLTIEDAFLIGQALASLYTEKGQTPRVIVTSDHRPSSEDLKKGLAQGLASSGAKVTIQKSPTPTGATSWYILKRASEFDIAIQITGSHNPYYNNGFKITCKQNELAEPDINGIPQALYGQGLQDLYQRILSGKIIRYSSPSEIQVIDTVVEEYQENMSKYFQKVLQGHNGKFKNQFSMVLDAGNGLGCTAIPIFKKLGIEIQELFTDLQGTFPNHPADPSKPDGVRYAQDKIKELNKGREKQLWFATVFDGDGDRSGVIDEQGQGIFPERILVVFYTRLLLENEQGFRLLSRLHEHVGLALDVRGTAVVCDVIGYYGRLLAQCQYYLEHGISSHLVDEYYRKALTKIWTEPNSTPKVPENFAKIPETEWKNIVTQQKGFGIIGEYIPAGYPNHRSYVRKQIQKLERIKNQYNLSIEEKGLLTKIQQQYTSAESSGHFFFGTCEEMPEVMIDDGIYSVLVLLNLLDTLDRYEVNSGLVPTKSEYTLTDIFQSITWRPVSNEIRDHAPQSNSQKFAIVNEIASMIKLEKSHPTGKFISPIRDIIDVDGIRAEFEDGSFALVRASNTSPMLTYKFEATTKTRLKEVIREMIKIMSIYVHQGISTIELEKEIALY